MRYQRVDTGGEKMKKINYRELGIFFALIILWIVLFATNKVFRAPHIYTSILREASFSGICGIGMTFCIASKHFDQSVASMNALLACSFTLILPGMAASLGVFGILLAMIIIVVLSIIFGILNGVFVAKLKIPAFIATLGTLYVFRSFAIIVSEGQPTIINQIVSPEQNKIFRYIGMGNVRIPFTQIETPIPFAFVVMVICGIIGTVILRKTSLGRHILAIGNSVEASRISGINIDRTKILVFALVGLFVGVGTILNTSFLGSSNPGMNMEFEFVVITATVLGGTALAGGKGSIFTTIVAAIFVVTVSAGMNAFRMDSFTQRIVMGVILLFAFSINEIRAMIERERVKAKARKEAAQQVIEPLSQE